MQLLFSKVVVQPEVSWCSEGTQLLRVDHQRTRHLMQGTMGQGSEEPLGDSPVTDQQPKEMLPMLL